MSWAAHIEHTAAGLAIRFAEPLSRLDMTADVAAHLASLLAVEARQRMAGVVRTLVAENASTSAVVRGNQHQNGHTSVQQMYREIPTVSLRPTVGRTGRGDRRGAQSDSLLPENMQVEVVDGHPLCCDCDGCLNGDKEP